MLHSHTWKENWDNFKLCSDITKQIFPVTWYHYQKDPITLIEFLEAIASPEVTFTLTHSVGHIFAFDNLSMTVVMSWSSLSIQCFVSIESIHPINPIHPIHSIHPIQPIHPIPQLILNAIKSIDKLGLSWAKLSSSLD